MGKCKGAVSDVIRTLLFLLHFRAPVVFGRAFLTVIRWHLPRVPPSYHWHSCCNPSSVRPEQSSIDNQQLLTTVFPRVSGKQETVITVRLPQAYYKTENRQRAEHLSFPPWAQTAAGTHFPLPPHCGCCALPGAHQGRAAFSLPRAFFKRGCCYLQLPCLPASVSLERRFSPPS